jgi:hypothetical protein
MAKSNDILLVIFIKKNQYLQLCLVRYLIRLLLVVKQQEMSMSFNVLRTVTSFGEFVLNYTFLSSCKPIADNTRLITFWVSTREQYSGLAKMISTINIH